MKYLDTWSQTRSHPQTLWEKAQLLWNDLKQTSQPKTLIGGLDPKTLARGVDISHWNGDVDIARMHREGGIDFVWAKSSDGYRVVEGSNTDPKNCVDDWWRRNVQKCYDEGVACGGYHYVQPFFNGYNNKGCADWNWECMQAAFENLVPKKSYHMLALDVEEKTATDYNGSDVVLDLIGRIAGDKKLSQVPLWIYSSNSVLNYYTKLRDQLTNPQAALNTNLWLAQWIFTKSQAITWSDLIEKIYPTIKMKVITPGFATWSQLQWAACYTVPGCNGGCDQDFYNGTPAAFNARIGFTPTTPPPPTEPPVTDGDTEARLTYLESAMSSLDARVDSIVTQLHAIN